MMGPQSISKEFAKMRLIDMSPEDMRKSVYGDKKQGDKLVNKKFSSPAYHVRSSFKASSILR